MKTRKQRAQWTLRPAENQAQKELAEIELCFTDLAFIGGLLLGWCLHVLWALVPR